MLVGFIGSFAFIRMSTRMIRAEVSWWPGNIESESGLHVHHLVFGIITMMVAGTVGFAAFGHSPLTEICAFFFGVGAGLTIDEFALWVYLEDVYWAQEGRSSIDATVIAAALIGLIVVGINPFEASDEGVTAIESISPGCSSSSSSPRASSRVGGCTASPGSSSRRWRSTRPAGSASRTRPGRTIATATTTRRSRRRPKSASTRAGGPTASRKPSATSSAASRARA